VKPASIIFLIVAVVLAIGGLTTMRIAEGIARKEGIEILNEISPETKDYRFVYEYEADSIGKISLNIKEAKINILTTTTKPYIELINFAEGTYEFASSNRIITINNNSDFSIISGIASKALNFKGLRSIVNYMNVNGLEKTINIYLSESYPVKIIDSKLEKGDVLIENSKTTTDYNIDIVSGGLYIKNIATTSTLKVKLGTGDLFIDNCVISNMAAEIGTGDIDILTSDFNTISAEIENGNFNFGYRYSLGLINLDLSSQSGIVRVDGEVKGSYYEIIDLPTYSKFKVMLSSGDIVIDSYKTAEDIID
jgi:hypothetical protein